MVVQQICMSPHVIIASIIVVLSCLSPAASARPYGAKVTAKRLSPNVWSYTIYNTSTTPDYYLYTVAFELCPVNIAVPNGWEAYWSGKDGGYWMNSSPNGEPVSSSYVTASDVGIAPGQMQGGFESDYEYRLDDGQIACMWWASFYGPNGDAECTGYVELDNDAVPEPASALFLGAAISSLVGASLRRRLKP